MHYKEVKGILSSRNGMNIYRGCTHGCIYCDSRSRCYNINHDFEDVEVKSNAVILLEESLRRKRKKCMIGTGAMSDPYTHIEEQLMHTRKALEIIDKYGFGLSIQTKSNRILRDLDLLKSINEKSKCVVQMTLTTYDEYLCKIIEPNVSSTKERFEVLKYIRIKESVMKKYEVVAAIIVYDEHILCMQRGKCKYEYVSYKYEFPGGKVELGESNVEALQRELQEEMDIKVIIRDEDFFMTVEHTYLDFEIIMHSYICYVDSKNFVRKEHVNHEWFRVDSTSQIHDNL